MWIVVRFFPVARIHSATRPASSGIRTASISTASRSPLISETEVAGQVGSPLLIGGISPVIGLYRTTKRSRCSGLDMAAPNESDMDVRAAEDRIPPVRPCSRRRVRAASRSSGRDSCGRSGLDQPVDGEECDLWWCIPHLLGGGQELLAGECLELLL